LIGSVIPQEARVPRTMSAVEALPRRKVMKSPGNGAERWRTDFLGIVGGGAWGPEPQAFLIEMQANDRILPHFHAVDQFQVFVAGQGGVGRGAFEPPVTVHYADRHTGYGPLDSGPQGYSYFTLRANTDPGPVYLHQPDYRSRLQPSKKRHSSHQLALSTAPVLAHRGEVALETVMPAQDDGLAAFLLRAGANAPVTGPSPAGSGGQFYLVLNGSLEQQGTQYPAWSTLFVDAREDALQFRAGSAGCEVLIAQFAT